MDNQARERVHQAITLLGYQRNEAAADQDGTLRPGDLVGQVIGLEDAGAALAAMDRPSATGMTVVRL